MYSLYNAFVLPLDISLRVSFDLCMATWPFVTIEILLLIWYCGGADDELLRIGTLPPVRLTFVQVVSLSCETIEAPV